MQYRGKSIEIIGKRQMFDKTFCWIHILENDEFKQVMIDEIEDYHSNLDALSYARYVSIAARIQGEIAQKRLLAPYESSLTPLPHQILVLEKVMQGLQTRYLLADEVGMGKTIEAGLVLKEKKLRGEVKRVLLIVPKSAMLQWQSELREHFCENFHIYDSSFINSMAKTFASFDAEDELNFWKQHNQIIVSSDALKPLTVRDGWSQKRVDEYNKYRLEAVLEAEFDMVIIDEAHRSVFGKYGAIFQYFDSLLIGLTATPRDEIDKNTFKLLELEDEPNYEYTFDEAVKDGYLVPYKAKRHNSKMINNGIKYDELTKEQRDELEKVWDYEKMLKGIDPNKEYHRDIEGNEIFRYLINDDTIDNVLVELMESGLKIKSGEDIGKTIIFAYNHKHAERIVERFHALYPNRGADYCQLIDNQVKHHDKIIREFKTPEKLPQIAVSVDMLDTGIDVPEVLNLVFFKIVKSKIKFEQMIGRGTRLCPNIFGEGKDKELFYIFDWCGNFDYFSKNPDGIDPANSKSLTERLFSLRLDIAKELQSADHQEKEFDKKMHDDLKVLLHQQVNSIVKERKDARPYWNIIEPFRDNEKWTYLSDVDVLRLKEIGKLIPQDDDDESAKKFDVIMLHLQLAHIDSTVRVGQFRQVVVNIAAHLEKKGTVPAVMTRIETIRNVQKPQFWENESLDSLESVRTELRDLIKLLEETRKTKKFIIDIDDPYETVDGGEDVIIQTTYKQRVIDYLAKNTDNPTLRKIQGFEQLTSGDFAELERIFFEELGTREDFNELAEGHPYKNNVAAFIRVINGIDRKKALQIYQNFIEGNNLTSEQERYLKNILDYVSVNGDIETRNFMEYPLKADSIVNEVFIS